MKGLISGLATEAEMRSVCPIAGTLSKWYIVASASPGGGTKAWRFTLLKNGIPTALQVTITGAATSGSDLVNSVTIAPGDILVMKCENLNSATYLDRYTAQGWVLTPDWDGQSMIMSMINTLRSASTKNAYQLQIAYRTALGYAAATRIQKSNAQTFRDLYVDLTNAPGAGKSWKFSLGVNGVESALTCTISGANKTGSDTTHEVTVADGDDVSFIAAPTGTPSLGQASWGLVCYVTLGAPSKCYGLHAGAMVEMLS
jgi:hypothetical protein